MTRATLDDIARGHVVPAIKTPLLDAVCIADATELHRVAPVDERTRYAAMRERAEAAEASEEGAREIMIAACSSRDAAIMAASGATVRADATQRLLDAERAHAAGLDRQLVAAWAIIRELRGEPATAADFAAMAGLPDDACPHCGMDATECPPGGRDDCATYHSLPTHGEVMALPGHEAAERREHPSEPPEALALDLVAFAASLRAPAAAGDAWPPEPTAAAVTELLTGLPEGEPPCTEADARDFLTATGARLGEEPPWGRAEEDDEIPVADGSGP